MAPFDLITREEALGGLPARQASTLLFLIETRTAHLIRQSRQITERFLTEDAEKERELAFYESFTLGRSPYPPPSIQHLERYAPQWALLVPKTPALRAAIARALGQKYRFTREAVPAIRTALGLDDETVRLAYQRLYGQPLEETVYAGAPGLGERLRWAWALFSTWLENLPPFWAVYALTLTETVGAGILALPIAVAGIGPLAGVVILVVLGLVNVLTVAFMAEAAARSGTIRYGSAYVGRMVADYLGGIGSGVLSAGMLAITALALLAYYIGFSMTMASVFPLPAWTWMVVLFALGLYYVSRDTLNSTIASALVVGAVNIGLILVLALIALTHLQPQNLAYTNIPFVGGAPFDPSILGLIFGVILAAYFGHLSVSTVSKTVMRRDPTGRSLLWGAAAAQLTVMILYCLWVIAVNGAIGPRQLATEPGTSLVPLAAEIGPIISVFGSIFVILGMGMASIHFSLGLFNLTRERLPVRHHPTLTMPRWRARLVFHRLAPRSSHLTLTYLGLDGDRPLLRFDICLGGQLQRVEARVDQSWRSTDLPDEIRALAGNKIRLELEILGATQQNVRLWVKSPMHISFEGEWETEGLSVANLLVLPAPQRKLITWLMRQPEAVGLGAVAGHLDRERDATRALLDSLVTQGYLKQVAGDGEPHYRAEVGYRRGSQTARQLLSPPAGKVQRTGAAPKPEISIWSRLLGDRGRFVLSIAPLFFVFLLAEWSLLTGSQTFSGVLSLLGVLVVAMLAGIFPVLLLLSSRRKGEYVPQATYRLMGNPVLLAFIYLLSLGSIIVHGLFIWEGLIERAVALLVGALIAIVTVVMARRGAFSPRAVIELCEHQGAEAESLLSVVAGGRPAVAEARLDYVDGERQVKATGIAAIPGLSGLRAASIRLDAPPARDVKLWLHRVTPEGSSEGLPARAAVRSGGEEQETALHLADGQIILPLSGDLEEVRLTLSDEAAQT